MFFVVYGSNHQIGLVDCVGFTPSQEVIALALNFSLPGVDDWRYCMVEPSSSSAQ